MKWILPLILAILAAACASERSTDPWRQAQDNALAANEAFRRCHRFVEGWLQYRDPKSGLFPHSLKSSVWTPCNSAADLYPFIVLTAYYTDPGWFQGMAREVLHTEIRLTNRVRRLPDAFALESQDFRNPEPDIHTIVYGASEYVKDGLIPISEVVGRDEWFYRMQDILEDILAESPVESQWGRLPADDTEVNGEMLQSLCRIFGATADPRFLNAAKRIADAYFFEVLPACNGIPTHRWDFAKHEAISDTLSLSDHGNEILGGLSEVFLACKTYDPDRYARYKPVMRKLINTLLLRATNEDGLWYSRIIPSTLEVKSRRTWDTWGYAMNAVYTTYLATGNEKYRAAVERALRNINKRRYKKQVGADSFADSIEGGIVLLNRIPTPEGFAWLEDVVPTFLRKQKKDGIIEGWYGDGNYARTALMYAMYKTKGTRIEPWRPDVRFGAAMQDNMLYVRLVADKPWTGKLHLDYPRHRYHMGLTVNYPRINEFPEWYTVQHELLYDVRIDDETIAITGAELIRGLPVKLGSDRPMQVTIQPRGAAPHEVPNSGD